MSLTINLRVEGHESPVRTAAFARKQGSVVEIEVVEDVCTIEVGGDATVFSANVTHNLCDMAGACGLYQPIWRPEELGTQEVRTLIPLIHAGLRRLKGDRGKYEKFNPENGWGDYDGLVRFAEGYLAACRSWPNAKVETYR